MNSIGCKTHPIDVFIMFNYFSVRRDFKYLTKRPIETTITRIRRAHFSLRIIPFPPKQKFATKMLHSHYNKCISVCQDFLIISCKEIYKYLHFL